MWVPIRSLSVLSSAKIDKRAILTLIDSKKYENIQKKFWLEVTGIFLLPVREAEW